MTTHHSLYKAIQGLFTPTTLLVTLIGLSACGGETPLPGSAPDGSGNPTNAPAPTAMPAPQPSATLVPQPSPTAMPQPTAAPMPPVQPTLPPLPEETPKPTAKPTPIPTQEPTTRPTQAPTPVPQPTSTPASGGDAYFREFTDENCTDGRYTETMPDLNADIDKMVSDMLALQSPTAEQMVQIQYDVFDKAYPFGSFILREAPAFGNSSGACALEFSDPGKYGIASIWPLAIHECGHSIDLTNRTYYISTENEVAMSRKDYFGRRGIFTDRFTADVPDGVANDTYFDPNTGGSNQGIITTYDEWNQYINSVATNYLLYRFPKLRYEYDLKLMLNFAWAAQRYLILAKEKHPQNYEEMMNDPIVREGTLKLWGRTWLYYDAFINDTTWSPSAGEDKYVDAIRNPELLGVINDVRKRHGCAGIQ